MKVRYFLSKSDYHQNGDKADYLSLHEPEFIIETLAHTTDSFSSGGANDKLIFLNYEVGASLQHPCT